MTTVAYVKGLFLGGSAVQLPATATGRMAHTTTSDSGSFWLPVQQTHKAERLGAGEAVLRCLVADETVVPVLRHPRTRRRSRVLLLPTTSIERLNNVQLFSILLFIFPKDPPPGNTLIFQA